MSITNSLRTLTADQVARFLGLMLVAWQPFISGARLPSILLLLLGIWLLFDRKVSFSDPAIHRLAAIFLLLLIPVLVSLPSSFNPGDTFNIAVALTLYFIVGLATMYGLRAQDDHIWLQRWLLIILMAWVADGYIQYFLGRDLLGVNMPNNGIILGPFPDNLHYGLFLAVLMPVALWRLTETRPFIAFACITSISFVVGMNGARSNVLFFLLGVTTLLLRFDWRYRAVIILSVLVGVILAINQSEATAAKFKQLSLSGDQGLFEQMDYTLSGRMTIWETAYNMLKDRPLTGVGAGAFDDAYDSYATRPDDPFRSGGSYPAGVYHAHQMYVSIAAESGLIGLGFLIASIFLLVRWYMRSPPENKKLAAPYAASLAVIAFPLQSQPVLYRVWWFPVVLLLLCGLITALQSRES